MANAVLTWSAPTKSADGSALTDLAGYDILRGLDNAAPTLLTSVGKVTTYTDASLPSVNASVSYLVKAFDNAGNRSAASNVVTKVYDANPPMPPTGLDVVVQ